MRLSTSERIRQYILVHGHVIYLIVAWLLTAVEIDWLLGQFCSMTYLSKFSLGQSFIWGGIIVFTFLLLPPRYRWIQLILFSVLVVFNMVNCLYLRNFSNFIPLRTIFMWQGINVFTFRAALASVAWSDAILWLALCGQIGLYWAMRKQLRSRGFNLRFKVGCCIVILSGLVLMERSRYRGFVNWWEGAFDRSAINMEAYLQITCSLWDYDRKGYFEAYLIQLYNLFKPVIPLSSDEAEEIRKIISYSGNRDMAYDVDSIVDKNRDKNLIFIIVESLNSCALNRTFDNKSFTPCMDSIIKAPDVICFDNISSQAMFGQSSDGQFMYNTGVYPLIDETTLAVERTGPFPSICRELPKHHSAEFIGESRLIWFHDETTVAYGYDELNDDLEDYRVLEGDEAIFAAAFQSLKTMRQPFFVLITTISMHGPYEFKGKLPDGWEEPASTYDFLCKTNIFDRSLSLFLSDLKKSGLYDNSVIVIAADHKATLSSLGAGGTDDGRIMFCVLNSGLSGKVDSRIAGQIDVYPTILDIMGVRNPRWPGMGQSLIREVPGFAVVRGTEIVGDTTDTAAIERQKRNWQLSDRMIKTNTFPSLH